MSLQGYAEPYWDAYVVEAFNLIARLDLVKVECYKAKYPDRWGSMEGEHKITLKPGYTPFAIVTPRRVPLPLMPKVKEELDRMEHMCHI